MLKVGWKPGKTMGLRNKAIGAVASLALSMGLFKDTPHFSYPTFPYGKVLATSAEISSYVEEKVRTTDYAAYLQDLESKLPELYDFKKDESKFASNLEPLMALMFYHSGTTTPVSLNLYHKKEGLFSKLLSKITAGKSFSWDRTLWIEKNSLDIRILFHEFGHHTDDNLDHLEFLLDDEHALRAETVADVFACSLGEYLASASRSDEGRRIFTDCIAEPLESLKGKSWDAVFADPENLSSQKMITFLYGTGMFSSLKEIYLFSRSLDPKAFFASAKVLVATYDPFVVLEKGSKMLKEREADLCKKISSAYCSILLHPGR